MEDRRFLHEGETLLASMRPSASYLIVSLIRGLLDTVIMGIAASLLLLAGWWFGFGAMAPSVAFVALFSVLFLAVSFRRWTLWKHATFRVTTERILVEHHDSIFTHPLHTVKWPQYQESSLGHRTVLDYLFRVRPIRIRYGTADGQMKIHFPALHYAEDLKHYLDKVDSAVRRGDIASLRPFVAKPRGKRDGMEN